jgi:hypothetical protein
MSVKKSEGFTAEERAAMRERAKELKAEERANKNRAAGERAVLAKIAEMPETDRAMAERLHEIVKASAPELSPKTWYGFSDKANLDEVAMWATSFALKELTAAAEARIGALVKRAAG